MPLLTALFDLHGSATRGQALRVFLALLGAMGAVALIEQLAPDYLRLVVPIAGFVGVWWWATAIRRLHDAGRSGAWALLLPVPILGMLLSLGVLLLRPGRPYNDSHAGLRAAGSLGLILVALYFLTRAFWAPFYSPTESMKPTLLVGDHFITRYANAASLARGDVVVFHHPIDGSITTQRLIGLPGDRVEIAGGALILNGQPLVQVDVGTLSETYGPLGPMGIMPRCRNAVVGMGGSCEVQLQRETLPEGRNYLTVNIEDASFSDNLGPFEVPDGQLVFLGDHRDNAIDSRFAQAAGGLGFVPGENVIGRVTRVIVSASGASVWAFWDWRGDRFFRSVE